MRPHRIRRSIYALFLFALAVRIALIFGLGAHRRGVQTAHHEHQTIASSLARGDGFRFNFFGHLDKPVLTSQQAPLVPGVLAGCHLLFGVESESSFLAMLSLQAFVSALTVVAVSCLAADVAGDQRVGRWTGVLAALYPPLAVSCCHIQALVWNLFWLSLLLTSTVRMRLHGNLASHVLFVIAAVGGLHTDPILGGVIGFLLLLLAFDVWTRNSAGGASLSMRLRGLHPVLWTTAAVAVGVVPWTVRNYLVHNRLVFIKDSLPYVFWQGNNEVSQGTDKLLVDAQAADVIAAQSSPRAANQAAFAARRQAVSVNICLTQPEILHLQSMDSEIERMDYFADKAQSRLVDHFDRYLALCGQRLYYLAWFDATNPRSYLWHYRVCYLSLASLGLLGLALRRFSWRDMLPVIAAALVLVTVHTLIITSARFRIPLEMLLLLPAGVATVRILEVLRECAWSGEEHRATQQREGDAAPLSGSIHFDGSPG